MLWNATTMRDHRVSQEVPGRYFRVIQILGSSDHHETGRERPVSRRSKQNRPGQKKCKGDVTVKGSERTRDRPQESGC